MWVSSRKKSLIFISLGACLVALAIALNVSWIVLNWREVALLTLGIVFFVAIISGMVLNTIFLVREIRRNEQHDSFINAVTHELKTPLASIRLYLETLKTRQVDEAKRQEFYDVMLADSDRLLHTVEQVLRAGQTGQRRRALDRSVIDMGRLVRECIDLASKRYHLDGDALGYTESLNGSERVTIMGDEDEMRAAISNLLDNAIKYSDKTVQVSVGLETLGDKLVAVRVTDRGIGIPRTQLKRVFKRFYRVPERILTQVKGSGLGLFIVRSVVKKHGGRAFAESEGEGKGSTFTIQLPRN